MSETAGNLKIKILEARLERDTSSFGSMDPYVVLETRMQRMRTATQKGAGKQPAWPNEEMAVDVKYIGDDIHVMIFDEKIASDDIVGEATIKLSALCVNGGIDEWWAITYKGKKVGDVHLKSQWISLGRALEEKPMGPPSQRPQLTYANGQQALDVSYYPTVFYHQDMGYGQPVQQPVDALAFYNTIDPDQSQHTLRQKENHILIGQPVRNNVQVAPSDSHGIIASGDSDHLPLLYQIGIAGLALLCFLVEILFAVSAGEKIHRDEGLLIEKQYKAVQLHFMILSILHFVFVLVTLGLTYAYKDNGRTLFLQCNLTSVVFKVFIVIFALFIAIKLYWLWFLFTLLLVLNVGAIGAFAYYAMMSGVRFKQMKISAGVSALCSVVALICLIYYYFQLSRAATGYVQGKMDLMFPTVKSYNYMQLYLGEELYNETKNDGQLKGSQELLSHRASLFKRTKKSKSKDYEDGEKWDDKDWDDKDWDEKEKKPKEKSSKEKELDEMWLIGLEQERLARESREKLMQREQELKEQRERERLERQQKENERVKREREEKKEQKRQEQEAIQRGKEEWLKKQEREKEERERKEQEQKEREAAAKKAEDALKVRAPIQLAAKTEPTMTDDMFYKANFDTTISEYDFCQGMKSACDTKLYKMDTTVSKKAKAYDKNLSKKSKAVVKAMGKKYFKIEELSVEAKDFAEKAIEKYDFENAENAVKYTVRIRHTQLVAKKVYDQGKAAKTGSDLAEAEFYLGLCLSKAQNENEKAEDEYQEALSFYGKAEGFRDLAQLRLKQAKERPGVIDQMWKGEFGLGYNPGPFGTNKKICERNIAKVNAAVKDFDRYYEAYDFEGMELQLNYIDQQAAPAIAAVDECREKWHSIKCSDPIHRTGCLDKLPDI